MTNLTSAQHRVEAAKNFDAAAESFERSDTDGFLSQWAHNLAGTRHLLEAELAEKNGKSEFLALFDLEGNPVPAKLINTRYGTAWLLLASDDPYGDTKGIVGNPTARKAERRAATLARKGYRVGFVKAQARVGTIANGTGLGGAATVQYRILRADGGYDPKAEFICWDSREF
jgi:hypothetical protein